MVYQNTASTIITHTYKIYNSTNVFKNWLLLIIDVDNLQLLLTQ